MADAIIDIDFKRDVINAVKELREQMQALTGTVQKVEQNSKSAFDGIRGTLKQLSFTNITTQLQNLSQGFADLNGPGMRFNASLQDLSALTGLAGSDLDDLATKARASAKEFGSDASSSIETYKTILGRLGPDIAKSSEALSIMERDVQIMAKTMGGDATAAVDALTTGVLQFGVDLSDPMNAAKEMSGMMDVMANSAKEGAAEVPAISAALKVSGVQLKQSRVDFVEANAAIQAMAAGGKEGAEAGTALRNVLGKMSGEDIIPKEAAGKLRKLGVDMRIVSDTSIPFTDRLRELKKAQGDATIMAQVFGVENAAAANILLDSVDAQDSLAKKIKDGAGAMSMASKVMESDEEKMKRFRASIDDVKLSFYEATGGATAYLQPISELAVTFSAFIPIVSAVSSAYTFLRNSERAAAIASGVLRVAKIALSGVMFGVTKGVQLLSQGFIWLKNTQLVTAVTTRVVAAAQWVWQGAVAGVTKAFTFLKESQVVGAIATKVITAAQWLWNAAMNANPIGAIILAVTAAVAAVYALSKALSFSTEAERLNGEMKAKVIEKTADQRAELDMLFNTLRTAKKGSEEYNNTLKELDRIQPGIIDKYNLQAGSMKDINAAQKEMIANIDAIAQAEAWKEMAVEKYKEAFKQQASGPSIVDKGMALFTPGISAQTYNKMDVQSAKNDAKYASEQLASLKQTSRYKTAVSVDKMRQHNDGMDPITDPVDPSKTAQTKPLVSPSGSSEKKYSGGGEMKNINVRIDQLIGNLTVQTTNLTEGMEQIKQKVVETLVGAVRDVEVAL